EDKVFSQDRKFHAFPRVAKVLERAAKELRLGQDRKGRRADAFERCRQTDGVKRLAQQPAAWRSRLELGHHINSRARERAYKVPQRRSRLDAILERRFWQHFLAVSDLAAPRLQHTVEHASTVDLSEHRRKFW